MEEELKRRESGSGKESGRGKDSGSRGVEEVNNDVIE